MLDFMRRNARSWGIKVALGVISLVFVFFMGGGGQIGAGPRALATVGNIEVTRPEFELAQRRNESYFRQQFQGQMTDEMLRQLNIPKMTFDQLVDGAVLRAEAERIGLSIPPEAIRDQIRRVPAFQSAGEFSVRLYEETLRAQSMSPGIFEESVRQELLQAQLADIVRRGSHISEDDAWQAYQKANRKMTLSYVAIESEPLAGGVTVEDAALTTFYEGKQDTWRRPPSVKVRTLSYKVADAALKVEVSDVDLNEYYELHKNTEFQSEEKVGARHILKTVEPTATPEAKAAVKASLEAIAKRIADGGDFQEIAKAESQDPGSAVKGGDLGLFGRGNMVPPFETAAFALEPGQRSEIVETDYGFHLIEVYEKKPVGIASFDEVKDKIRTSLATRTATDRVFDDSAEDSAKISDGATLDAIATARGIKVEETPLFSQGDVVPGIGPAPQFMDAAFTLGSPGDVSQPVKVGNDYYILSLVERKDSYVPALSEVRAEVELAYRSEKALDLARDKADAFLEQAKGGTPLKQIAEQNNLKVETAEEVSVGTNFVKGVGAVQGLSEIAFGTAKDGEALARSFVNGGKAYVFVRESVTEPDKAAFEAVKKDELEKLEAAREQDALGEFIRARKEQEKISYDLAQLGPLLGAGAPRE